MNEQGSNSVLKLYPNPEKMPDKPYFTKEIFLISSNQRLVISHTGRSSGNENYPKYYRYNHEKSRNYTLWRNEWANNLCK